MAFEFQISDEFKNVLNSHQGAIQEARTMEKQMGGLNLPEDTKGTATLVKISGGQNRPQKDNETGQMIAGSHYVEFKSVVNTPPQHKGELASRRLNLNQTDNMTVAQRWGRVYDYMEDMGMPRNLRETGDFNQMANWFAQAERSFDYEVEGYDFNGRRNKNFEAKGAAGSSGMPQPTQTTQQAVQQPQVAPANTQQFNPQTGQAIQQPVEQQYQQPTQQPVQQPTQQVQQPQHQPQQTHAFQVGQRVSANGNPSTIQRIEGNLATVRLEANGQEMPVAVNMLRVI